MQSDGFQSGPPGQQPGGFPPAPQSGFGAPPQGYPPQQPGYGAPPPQGYPPQQPGYGAPPPQGYPPQQPGYGAPPPTFSGPPQPGYGMPPQGYAPTPGFPPGPPGKGPRKKGRGGLIAVIAVVVVVLVIGAVAAVALNGKKSPSTAGNSSNTSGNTGSQSGNTPGATPTPTTPPSSGTAPAGYKQYSNSFFSIDYPQDWILSPSDSSTSTTSITGLEGEVLEVDVENVGDENTSQLLTLYCQTLGDDSPGSPTNVTIGGQQWQQLVCQSNGQPVASIAAVTYKGHIFSINTLSTATPFSTDNTQFYQPMIQSFAFTS